MIRKFLNKNSTAGVIFALPFIIGFFIFMIVPMGMSLYYSFCEFEILGAPKWVGFANYMKMFTDDEVFYKSLSVTFFYVLTSVPMRLLFALIVALILVKNTKLTGFYRAAYYLPSIIGGSVAISILWKRLFAEDGTVNRLLQLIGIDSHYSWLGSKDTAIWVLILLSVWQFGSSMLVFLSALKQIPSTLYEAAKVDGAGGIGRFFKITLPLLTPTIFFNLIMQMISGFLAFTQCFIITQGRPMNSTLFYSVYMYQQSFSYYNTGYGAAMAWVMLLIISLMTLLLFGTKKFWVYGGGL
ncbi:MAG: sugar ABC transporter permease [Lachnospiraceae bacterium]|jgi:multiple sugar transport system permease protein|nr:sugar ABC transporter permease [Lachnospiraceae bacterium]